MLKESRSGGAFVAFSDVVLKNGGVVYGCIMDEDFNVLHTRAEDETGRNKMCKSKYVKSDTKYQKIFKQVEKDLEENRMVLFSGTACQAGGLVSYLKAKKVNISNLFTLDIICHGCPSPKIFKSYIRYLEKKFKGKISDYEFRDKSMAGWEGNVETAVVGGKKRKIHYWNKLFLSDLALMPACYNCKYKSVNRISDITIGDAWGVKKAAPGFYDKNGVSICLIHTEKGKKLFDLIKESCFILEHPLCGPLLQKHLYQSAKPQKSREEFWETYYDGGIEKLIKKYATDNLLSKAKKKMKNILKKIGLSRKGK